MKTLANSVYIKIATTTKKKIYKTVLSKANNPTDIFFFLFFLFQTDSTTKVLILLRQQCVSVVKFLPSLQHVLGPEKCDTSHRAKVRSRYTISFRRNQSLPIRTKGLRNLRLRSFVTTFWDKLTFIHYSFGALFRVKL